MTYYTKTRDGADARVYAIDGAEPFPIHGAVRNENGWRDCSWTRKGVFIVGLVGPLDLADIDAVMEAMGDG